MPPEQPQTFHRWSGEYLTRGEWSDAPSTADRVAPALGSEPLVSARHLLLPIALPTFTITDEPARIEALSSENQLDLRVQFAHSVELRLMPTGRRFSSREVWRAAYALGMRWGNMDLFHWRNPSREKAEQIVLFTLSALGDPAYFLPERATEGESIAGLALSFELPGNPAPIATFDRMAVALNYLRQMLGGRPIAADGGELDHDRLYDERDELEDTVLRMTGWGIAPGSPAAARFF